LELDEDLLLIDMLRELIIVEGSFFVYLFSCFLVHLKKSNPRLARRFIILVTLVLTLLFVATLLIIFTEKPPPQPSISINVSCSTSNVTVYVKNGGNDPIPDGNIVLHIIGAYLENVTDIQREIYFKELYPNETSLYTIDVDLIANGTYSVTIVIRPGLMKVVAETVTCKVT
jgi:hypothetical protein